MTADNGDVAAPPTRQEIEDYHKVIGATTLFDADVDPVKLVIKGLLRVSCGWLNTNSVDHILRHHQLVAGKHGEKPYLTRRGQTMLWAEMAPRI